MTLRLGEAGRRLSRTISHYRTDREMGIGMMLERVVDYEAEVRSLQAESGRPDRGFFLPLFF